MIFEKIATQPCIQARRFLLRPLRATDAPLVAKYAGDKRVSQMTNSIPYPLTLEAAEDFIKRATSGERPEDVWVLDGAAQGFGDLLGLISLKYIERTQSEIGFWVCPDYWNQGFAREAIETLMTENPHDSRSIVACVFQDNAASARVLTGRGFALLGEAEAFCLSRGQHVPTWTYLKSL